MPSPRFLVPILVLVLSAGCSGDRKEAEVISRAGGDARPASSQTSPAPRGETNLRIEPADVRRGTTVLARQASPLPAETRVEWLVNGIPAQDGGVTMDTSSLKKGDTIQARAGGTSFSQPVTIRNSPPEMRGVRFVPGDGGPGNSLGVEAEAYDADGDAVKIEIEWRKNGEPAGAGSQLGVPVKKGDKILVTLTPFDGEERGKSAALSREIRNTNPMIEGQERFQVSGNVVTFHVRASDADGDPLGYSIKDAPAGMLIDRASGWVRWETAPGTTGKVPFDVTVSDGAGGESTARFTVTISEQPPAGAQ